MITTPAETGTPETPPAVTAEYNAQVIAEFRRNDGRMSGQLAGAPLLLLTTPRPGGRLRVTPLVYLPYPKDRDGDPDAGWIVFAAHEGADRDPAWCMALRQDPHAKVEVVADGVCSEFWVTATFLDGAVHDHYWARHCEAFPFYRAYAERSARWIIPSIALLPARRRLDQLTRGGLPAPIPAQQPR